MKKTEYAETAGTYISITSYTMVSSGPPTAGTAVSPGSIPAGPAKTHVLIGSAGRATCPFCPYNHKITAQDAGVIHQKAEKLGGA